MKNIVIIEVTGKNINNFIKRLQNNNINIYKIKKINSETIIINIDNNNLEKINEIKTIYNINIKDYKGINKLKFIIKKNIYLIISIFLCSLIFIFLLNIIFDVEIVHNNLEIRNLLSGELKKYGLIADKEYINPINNESMDSYCIYVTYNPSIKQHEYTVDENCPQSSVIMNSHSLPKELEDYVDSVDIEIKKPKNDDIINSITNYSQIVYRLFGIPKLYFWNSNHYVITQLDWVIFFWNSK